MGKQGILSRSFLVTLGLLLGIELAVRTLFKENMAGRFEYGFHPTAGFVEEDGRLHLKRTGGRRFRPQTLDLLPSKERKRIFVIGDSVTRGSSVETSYTGRLVEKLARKGIAVESCNLGVGGHGARRKHLTLLQSLNYRPDLVILHINNSNEFEDEREYMRSQEFKTWHPKNWPMKSLAVRRLYEMKTEKVFWEWIPHSIRIQHAENDADAEISAKSAEGALARWNRRVEEVTGGSIRTCAAQGTPVLLLTQSYNREGSNGQRTLEDDGLDAIAKRLSGDGVFHLSMKAVFQDMDFHSLFVDSSHLLTEGHEKLAMALADKIVAAELFVEQDK